MKTFWPSVPSMATENFGCAELDKFLFFPRHLFFISRFNPSTYCSLTEHPFLFPVLTQVLTVLSLTEHVMYYSIIHIYFAKTMSSTVGQVHVHKYLVSSGFTIYFNNFWYDFAQMSDVFLALLCIHNLAPEFVNTVNQLLLCLWFYFPSNVFFQLVPQILNRIEVGGFRWCSPPVYASLFHEVLRTPRCVLRIIVLHKLVTRRKLLLKERHQAAIQDLRVQWRIHLPLKYADLSWALLADACPHVNFGRMLCSVKQKNVC